MSKHRTTAETDVSTALRRMLRDDEVLFWHYRPPWGLYVRQRLVSTVLIGLIVMTILYLFVAIPALLDFGDLIESMLGVNPPVAVVLGWVVLQVVWFVVAMLSNYNAYDRIEFAATNQRAIQLGGIVGLDTSAVDWRNVQDIEMTTNVLTHLFGTGPITLRAANGGVSFRGVEDPMGVIDRLEAIRRGEYDGPAIPVAERDVPRPDTLETSTADESELPEHVRQVVHADEDVVWHGTPTLMSFTLPAFVTGIVTLAVAVGIVVAYPKWVLFALVAVGGVKRAGHRILRYWNAEYVATTERVIQFDGAIGRDYSSVARDDVQDIEVATGLVDSVFGTGTLRFSRAGRATPQERNADGDGDGPAFAGVKFESVPAPHAVVDRIETAQTAS